MTRLMSTTAGRIAANLLLAMLYWALGTAALRIVQGTGLASPIWPAAGLAFGLVFQYGLVLLPGVLLGSFATNLHAIAMGVATAPGATVVVPVLIALGACAEAVVATELAHRRIGRHPSLVAPTQILWLLGVAAPIGTLPAALLGLGTQLTFGVVPLDSSLRVGTTWWVGDTLGIVVFGVVTHMLLPEQHEVWRQRRAKVALPALAAVAVSMLLFLQGATLGLQQRDAQLANLADNAAHAVDAQLQQLDATLIGLRGLFLASQDVTRAEFRTYTAGALATQPALLALSWNPAVDDAGLPGLVASMRAEYPGFRVTQRDANGAVVPVTSRPRHVVVAYIEPEAANASAVGFDIAADPLRGAAVTAAISTGRLTATAPVRLVQLETGDAGFLAMLPVFHGLTTPTTAAGRAHQLRGFVVAVYRDVPMLRTAFDGAQWHDVTLRLTDVTDARTPLPMAAQHSIVAGTALPTQRRAIAAFGRTWRLEVTQVSATPIPEQLVNEPIVMLAGLTIAVVLMAFLLLLSGMERQARREADIDPLTGLANRRALLRALEAARRASQGAGTRHVLLFADLDRFKPVNDRAGHATGDQLLRDIAGILHDAVRETDTVARMGGDEFAVLLQDCTSERGRAIAEAIVRSVHAHRVDVGGTAMGVGVSIGLTTILPPDPEDADVILAEADHAAYAAKFAGGDRVVMHGAPTDLARD